MLLGVLGIVFFPFLFQGRTLLPADLMDTMTLPFSHYFGSEHAFNSLITDGYLQFYPLKQFTKLAYEHQQFAFWNPLILNGYPQYLEGMWTYNVLLFLPFELAFRLLLLSPLLIGGVGMYRLLRDYDIRPGVSRIFATTYMLNGLFITQLLAHFIPAAFSFVPWCILFLHKYHSNGRYRFLAFSAVSLAFGFLSGNLQTIGFLIAVVCLYWVSLWLSADSHSWSELRPLTFVLSFGIGMAAIMILPMLELVRETAEHGAFFSTSLLRSYSLLQRLESVGLLATFFVPQLAGSIRGVTLHQIVGVYPQDFQGSIGFLPLMVAVWAGIVLWRSNPQVRPFAVLMLVGVVLPILTPLFHLVYHRFFVVFVFGACGAGAMGLETILRQGNSLSLSLKRWTTAFSIALAAVVMALLLVSLVRVFDRVGMEGFFRSQLWPRLCHVVFSEGNPGWVLARYKEALDYWRLGRPELIFGIGSSIVALALLSLRSRLSATRFLSGLWLLSVLQLGYFAYLWFPTNPSSQYPLYPNAPETTMLRHLSNNSRVYCYREVDSARQFVFLDNQNVIYDIPEATGYESLTPRSLYVYTSVLHWRDTGLVTPEFLGKFDIGTLVRAKPLPFPSLQCLESGPLWIYRNPFVFPRAYLAHRAVLVRNDSIALTRMTDTKLAWPLAYIQSRQGIKPLSDSVSSSDRVSIDHSEANSMTLSVYSPDSSYLLITDTYYPGWQATIDGKHAPILRANYAMRAMLLPPGLHTIRMRFEPLSFRVGMWVSVSSFVLLIVIPLFRNRMNGAQRHSRRLRENGQIQN